MNALHVGQRVRKVRGDLNVGMEFTIVAFDNDPSGLTVGMVTERPIAGYRGGIGVVVSAGETVWTAPQNLEPIVPPHQVGDWAAIDKLLPNLRGVTA